MFYYLITMPSDHLTFTNEPSQHNSSVSKDETLTYNERLVQGHVGNVSALHTAAQNGSTQDCPIILSSINVQHYFLLALSVLF